MSAGRIMGANQKWMEARDSLKRERDNGTRVKQIVFEGERST